MEVVLFLIFIVLIGLLVFVEKNKSFDFIVGAIIADLNSRYDKLILLGFEKDIYNLNYAGFNNISREMTIKTKGMPRRIIKYEDITEVHISEENNKYIIRLSISNYPPFEIDLLDNGSHAECGIKIKEEAVKMMNAVKFIIENN
jgi:hypothetical protein